MKVGSLFSGYGGLDLAIGGDLAWYSEIEPAACKVMEAHYPGVPNLGDITQVDWAEVEPVDVITGGYPCQPFSSAGMRKGKHDERHLWPHVRDAISAIRPRRAVLENVRGHLSLGFDDVLADLATLGLSARWGVVRAADAGAPHNRARLFIVAYAKCKRCDRARVAATAQSPTCGRSHAKRSANNVADASRTERRAPQPNHLGSSEWSAELGERAGAVANSQVITRRRGSDDDKAERQQGFSESAWGAFAVAIERWQGVLGRPAPAPTIQRAGRDRLNPVFVEWMMGLPEGWVTGHGLSASQELKMLGNGVVPQQAALALQLLGSVA